MMDDSKNIFVVDDDPFMREAIFRVIKRDLPEIEIVSLESGEETLEKLEETIPDLILLDIMMQGISGLQVLKQMRMNENENIKNIPVIILSAVGSRDIIQEARNMGAYDYILKPINKKVFIHKIKEIFK